MHYSPVPVLPIASAPDALLSRDPLTDLRAILNATEVLIPAGLIAFAQWGDGWGPICFDVQNRRADGDCPVLWLDHEKLAVPGEKVARR